MDKHAFADMQQRKCEARAAALARRDALGAALRAGKSDLIAHTLTGLDLFRRSRCVFIYVSVRSEVATGGIISAALAYSKTVCVPLIDAAAQRMDARVITDPDRDLHSGRLGILEPDERICPQAALSDIDLAVVPGLAFTPAGHRIGYGGGFYDRFLGEWQGNSCALAFEEQVVETLPFNPDHDTAVSHIITDARTINCAGAMF